MPDVPPAGPHPEPLPRTAPVQMAAAEACPPATSAKMSGALTVSTDLRRALRARAHALSPVVLVGSAGVSDAVLNEIDKALTAHELIKVRLTGLDRGDQSAEADRICLRLAAAPIQRIGHVLVIWRPNPEGH